MAELKNTLVNGSLAAKRIYEGGTPLDQRYISTIEYIDGKLKFGNGASVSLPTGQVNLTNMTQSANNTGVLISQVTGVIPTRSVYIDSISIPASKIFNTVNSKGVINKIDVSGSAENSAYIDTLKLSSYDSVNKAYINNIYGSGEIYTGLATGKESFELETYNIRGVSSSYKGKLNNLVIDNFGVINNEFIMAKGSIGEIENSGVIGTISGTGRISNFTLTGTIDVMTDSRVISNLGSSTKFGTIIINKNGVSSTNKGKVVISDNTNGIVSIWGTSGDKTVQVSGRTVTVDTTQITDTNGDLINGSYSTTNLSTTTTDTGISIKHNAGFIKSSNVYISKITVPLGRELNSVINNGTITTVLNNSGTVKILSGSVTINSHNSSTTIESNSGTVSIGTNTGTVNVTSNQSVVNYNNTWKISHDTDGNLEFTLI